MGIIDRILLYLAFFSHKEKRYCSRTRMGTNSRSDKANHKVLIAKALFDQLCHIAGIFLTVSVADEDALLAVAVAANLLFHAVHQCLKRLLSAAYLCQRNQFALVIHVQHRLYANHCAHQSCGLGDSAASLQIL